MQHHFYPAKNRNSPKTPLPRLCSSLGHRNPEKVYGTSGRGKIPKVSVLEAESSRRRHDSTSFLDEILYFLNFWHTSALAPRNLNAVELKGPKPALPGNGAPEEKPRPHGHTTSKRLLLSIRSDKIH
jgi:hypothetical protein